MPRGDKSAYTDKQKRQAEHIEKGYEHRGVPEDEAERRARATGNKETGGGKNSGSGRASRKIMAIPQGEGSAAPHQPHGQPLHDQRRRRGPRQPASAKRLTGDLAHAFALATMPWCLGGLYGAQRVTCGG